MPGALITGASSGLGLEYVRQLSGRGWRVFATARNLSTAAELNDLASATPSVTVHSADMADPASITALASELAGEPVDLLVNNAGTYGPQGFPEGMHYQTLGSFDPIVWSDMMRVNLIAPALMVEAFLRNLECSGRKMVVMMSSDLGSIANNRQGGSHAYRTSKTALNMLAKGLALDLAGKGVIVIAMAPGWTRTKLGGEQAPLSTEESVADQLRVIEALTPAQSGSFLNLNGETVPW